jgi:hypothetical protein
MPGRVFMQAFQHIASCDNVVADTLSRPPESAPEEGQGQVVLDSQSQGPWRGSLNQPSTVLPLASSPSVGMPNLDQVYYNWIVIQKSCPVQDGVRLPPL